jgi:hypothetical protein
MGPIGGPAPSRTGGQTVGHNVTWNWTCVIVLKIADSSSHQRGRPTWKDKESNCHSNKCNIWSPDPKEARHQDELAYSPSVVMWLRLRFTRIRDPHMIFNRPYDYDYITKSCRQQAEVVQIMKMFATLDKAKPHTENIRGLNLAAVMCTTVQVSRLSL